METRVGVARMRQVGGHLALDFVNTRSGPPVGPAEDEALAGYADLADWAGHVDLLRPADVARLHRQARRDPEAAAAAYARAWQVRERLDLVFRGIARGDGPPGHALAGLAADLREALAHADLRPRGTRFAWDWTGHRGLSRPLWPVVYAAVELLQTGRLERIKGCAGCRFLFLDESKNRSRRWCSMDDCGSDAKVRRYLAARRAARG